MNWKGFGMKRSWLNFKVLSRHAPGGTEETHGKNPGPPEYEGGVLTTQRRSSVSKSKAVPLHAMETLGGRGGIAPTHSRPRY
jgi:hypothetical protein